MRKFYKKATTKPIKGGFHILLDEKPIKTPTGAVVICPTQSLAKAVAHEWQEQVEKIQLKLMPLTTFCYAAIDQIAHNKELIISETAAFTGSDLICYRAQAPLDLQQQEAELWDPIMAWLKENHGLSLNITVGVKHVAQPPETLVFMQKYLSERSDFELAALQTMTSILGSIFLSFAFHQKLIDREQAWLASRVDENFQTKIWGEDDEAKVISKNKMNQFYAACHFLILAQSDKK